jgi:hypothetical protein
MIRKGARWNTCVPVFCGPLEFCPKILAVGFSSPKTPVFIFAVTEDPGFQ